MILKPEKLRRYELNRRLALAGVLPMVVYIILSETFPNDKLWWLVSFLKRFRYLPEVIIVLAVLSSFVMLFYWWQVYQRSPSYWEARYSALMVGQGVQAGTITGEGKYGKLPEFTADVLTIAIVGGLVLVGLLSFGFEISFVEVTNVNSLYFLGIGIVLFGLIRPYMGKRIQNWLK